MEDRLGRALSGWADRNRIEERERERTRTAILLMPDVDALWWDQFNQQMARLSARTQQPYSRVPALGAAGGVFTA